MENEKKKILIVEDEAPIAEALKIKLDRVGLESRIVADGEKALEELSADHFDLMVLDIIIPKIDGFLVLTAMKAKNIVLPVVVMTNLSSPNNMEKLKMLGVKKVFVKADVSLASMVENIKKIIQ